MDRAELGRLIREKGLSRVEEFLLSCARPSIRIRTARASDSTLKLGQSRIGGVPDLPKGMDWPTHQGGPLAFLAQFSLEDLGPLDVEKVLPPRGHLYFFYDALNQPWGFDPKDRGSWKVVHVDGAELVRGRPPRELKGPGEFHSCTLHLGRAVSLPDVRVLYERDPEFSRPEHEAYDQLISTIDRKAGMGAERHQLLGVADRVQNDMELECQLVSNGVYCGGSDDEADPRAAALQAGAADWRLLFQLDSDDAAATMWGDLGRVYFWIRKQDLAACRFDGVWTILQCG